MQLRAYSDTQWDLTPPALRALEIALQSTDIFLSLRFTFLRQNPSDQKVMIYESLYQLNETLRDAFLDVLNTTSPTTTLTLPSLYPSYLRLPITGKPLYVSTSNHLTRCRSLSHMRENLSGYRRFRSNPSRSRSIARSRCRP